MTSDETKKKISLAIKKRWKERLYKPRKQNESIKSKISASIKKKWDDKEYDGLRGKSLSTKHKKKISKSIAETWKNQDYRNNKIESLQSYWLNEDVKIEARERAQKLWSDDDYRKKTLKRIRENNFSQKHRKKMSAASTKRSAEISQFFIQFWSKNKDLLRENSIKMWQSKEYRDKMENIIDSAKHKMKIKEYYSNDKVIKAISDRSKDLWSDPEYRCKIIDSWDEELREKQSVISKERWKDDDYRVRMIKIIRNRWEDVNFRNKMAKVRLKQSYKVSNIQKQLYSLLDDLKVKYYREYEGDCDKECIIGPWRFDCLIPRNNMSDLLIECQGDYWHSMPQKVLRDKQKLSYINNNFAGKYEVKYLWEHEFYNQNKILELLKYWLNISECTTDFNFKEVQVSEVQNHEAKLFLEKYHYLCGVGRGGIKYGAKLNGELIGVIVFSPLVRQNIDDNRTCRELSRLCISPLYQKKNFASWFIAKCIKLLPKNYNKIISYCDTTFNHDGTVYKASNFTRVGIVKPDYWYVSEDGWVMHKKTLYNRAVKMSMKEKEFADAYGYIKVFGKNKIKFEYIRS